MDRNNLPKTATAEIAGMKFTVNQNGRIVGEKEATLRKAASACGLRREGKGEWYVNCEALATAFGLR